ncbi:uncharacterized protein LOC135296419 isoform X3 [Passer domesticus]|uniref:uncharacterized protein LOC135296419 isoform X3 n=1 Tax=Passer domesticus TaxID=48849 RepID=UPI0030FE8BC1
MGQPQHRCSTCSSAKPPLQFSWSFLMSYIWRSSLPMSQASCGEKSTCWMLNRTFLLSGMKGCYLSRAKRELRAMNIWLLLSALVYLRRCLSTSTREQGSSKTHIFYAVEIDGDSNTASFLAKQHGMQFISKVKWVNIRQLIIETCMLLSQSRMTEQVMVTIEFAGVPRMRI